MDVDQQTYELRPTQDYAILLLQEQQSLAEKQELIVEQTQALVNGQKELQIAVQQFQHMSPAAHKRKRPTASGSPDDADDEDEDLSDDEARPRKKKDKLPPIFHVMLIFISHRS